MRATGTSSPKTCMKPAKAALPLPPDLDPLMEEVEQAQSAATEHAREAILSPRYTDSLLKLLRWFEARGWRDQPVSKHSASLMTPIGDIAPALLDRRYRQAMKRSKHFAKLDLAQRHKLRIALKKLRYMTEFLGDLFDRRAGQGLPAHAEAAAGHARRGQRRARRARLWSQGSTRRRRGGGARCRHCPRLARSRPRRWRAQGCASTCVACARSSHFGDEPRRRYPQPSISAPPSWKG